MRTRSSKLLTCSERTGFDNQKPTIRTAASEPKRFFCIEFLWRPRARDDDDDERRKLPPPAFFCRRRSRAFLASRL